MNPFVWLLWFNRRMLYALRPPPRKPVLRVIEGERVSPRADAPRSRRGAGR